jgi:CRP-like cAMP-binding protein
MPSGRTFTAAVHLPGDFHGLAPVISQEPYIYTVLCKEKTVLVRIDGEVLRDIIAANGRLSFSLFSALERRFLRALNLHASAAVDSVQTRIAALLKSVDARSVKGRPADGISLSQDEIAGMLGTRRQVVNRALREMMAEGAIQAQYGRIAIIDREKLDKMAPDSN